MAFASAANARSGLTDFGFVPPRFESIDTSEAIPEGVITALAQDKQGFIWIGTQNGLVRFDGYRLRLFAHIESDPASLGGDYVVSLAASKDGRLWVGTASDGVSVFDPASERFTRYSHAAGKPDSISAGRIWAMQEDELGGMWFATDHGLDHLAPQQTRFRHVQHAATGVGALSVNRILSLCLDRSNRLWVGSAAGLQRLSVDRQHLERVRHPELATENIQTLFEAADGKIWIGTLERGVAWLAPGTETPHWLAPNVSAGAGKRIGGIAQPFPGQIWLATHGGGIAIVSATTGALLQVVRHDPGMRSSLAHDSVLPLLKDRTGLLWIGTWGGGLQWFDSRASMATLLRHGSMQKNGLSQAEVTRILELADGRILFGLAGNGIDVVDRKRGRIDGYRADIGGLPEGSIRGLAETSDGTLWVGMRDSGVVRRLRGSTRWQPVAGVPGSQVRTLLALRDGSVVVGTDEGIARWDGQQTASGMARFVRLQDARGQAMPYRISALLEDGEGRIWAGSENGLWLWQAGSREWLGEWLGIHPQPGRLDSLPSDFVTSLLLDHAGRLWVATDKGIARLALQAGKPLDQRAVFVNINTAFGQTDRDLGNSMLEDAMGRIWTENALIDTVQGKVHPLGRADGLDMGTGIIGSVGKTRDGLLIFGGPNGAAIIDPAHFHPRAFHPPLVITGLQIDGLPSTPATLLEGAKPQLTLQPEQRSFSIEFARLDFADPKKNRYEYRLLGVDKAWLNSDVESRRASYTNLWPGFYTLQIRSSNRLGQWDVQELVIPVRILPAYWQTGGFMAAVTVLALALVVGLHRWRVRHLQRQAERLQQRIDARVADILRISRIGQELTATLDIEQAMDQVYRQVETRLDTSVFLIGMIDAVRQNIRFPYLIEHGQRLPAMSLCLSEHARPAVWCVREQRELILQRREDMQQYVSEVLPPMTGAAMQTVVYLPLQVGDEIIGCLSVQSPQQFAYQPEQLEFLRILASYTAIALSNSIAHQELHQSHGELAAALQRVQETRSKLVQAEKMASLGNLVVGIAHEINTPLGTTMTAISGAASAWDSINTAISGNQVSKAALLACAEEGVEYTDLAARSASRAADLINSFKAIAVQADSGVGQVLDLTQYLTGHALLQEPGLDAARCHVRFDLPANLFYHTLPDVLGLALAPIFANWLDHAFADGRNGTAWVGAHAEPGGSVVIEIGDDGWGIAPDNLPKVFDPFFTTKSGMGGHIGLGLHVAFNQITERLKGEISIASTVGAGTTVSIRLPAAGSACG